MSATRDRWLPWVNRALAAPLTARGADVSARADAIVVLGSTIVRGQLSRAGEERVAISVQLWRRGLAPLVCMTGGASSSPTQADAMAARARELGIPEGALLVERESRTTAENASRAAPLLRSRGCRRLWLVTQPFHTRRARWLFRRQGFEVHAWYARDSIQYRRHRAAVQWILREYAAWGKLALTATSDWLARPPRPR